jgi:spermidine synthase
MGKDIPLKKTSAILLIITTLSGAAGLGYEIVWTRMLTLGLGHETPAILAVLAAFFGGSALGSWFFDSRISQSNFPARWYALLEAVTFAWAIILAFFLPLLSMATVRIIGVAPSPGLQWTLSFILPFFYFLPATCAMGGTLIAIERILSRFSGHAAIAATYAANTFGAVAGVLATSFFLLPAAGFLKTLIVLSFLSAVCSMTIIVLNVPGRPDIVDAAPTLRRSIYSALFLTGLTGIGYEILMVRALAQVLENTVYSFAAVLAVYLFGTFTGAVLCQSNRLKLNNNAMVVMLVFSVMVGSVLLRITPGLFSVFAHVGEGSLPAMVVFEHAISLVVLLVPTIAMGYSFSHLSYQVRGTCCGFGRALAVNTVGGMIAPVLFGVVLLPVVGLKTLLVACSACYASLLLLPGFASGKSGRIIAGIITLTFIIISAIFTPATSFFTRLQAGDTIVKVIDGVMATCTVVADKSGGRHLLFNSRFQEGGTSSPLADGREAVIPILLHPDPHEVLFLGVGAGVTFTTAGWFGNIRADGVELVPEVRSLLKYFIEGILPANCNLITADARRYAAVCPKKYDVIIADLYHPARDGAGFLYTREHFSAIKRLLVQQGIFCQWLPLYQMDETTLRSIMHTFSDVFPHSAAWLVNYSVEMPILGLIGSMEPLTIDPHRVESLISSQTMKEHLESLKLYSTVSLTGGFIGSSRSIKLFSGSGALNSDDCPGIMYDAPRFAYGNRRATPDEIVAHLLDSFSADGHELFSASDSTMAHEDLALRYNRYRKARDRFMQMGIKITRSGGVSGEDALIDSLFSFAQLSGDFEGAYNPLLGIALRKYRDDPHMSLSILRKLAALCHERGEAFSIIKEIEARETTPGG